MAVVVHDSSHESALDVIEAQPQISLPAKQRSASSFWTHFQGIGVDVSQLPRHVKEYYDKHASGGKQSFSERSINIEVQGSDERITIAATVSTTVLEVKQLIAAMTQVDAGSIRVKRKTGRRVSSQQDWEEVASNILVSGIQSIRRESRKYDHPLAIIGAGLGAIQTAICLESHGQKDFVLFDKCQDFGGASWITVANKYTKLQTESGTYHVDYIRPTVPAAKRLKNSETWPSRDALLTMFREQADAAGLREKTFFNTAIEKLEVRESKKAVDAYSKQYILHAQPVQVRRDETNEAAYGEVFVASALLSWPGNLSSVNTIEFPGEDDFDGYIEYSSFDRVDYTKAEGKKVILYGHGAFVIENVRTLLEHRAKKVFIMCRKRNLCGMRMVSWLVAHEEQPVPAHILLDAMQKMYDLLDFDVWTADSVSTDLKKSYAFIDQKTAFGVTDMYFLAGYYGLMEVIVDEIKRLTRHCAHCLKRTRLIGVEMIVKAIGTLPDPKVDKLLQLKELVGYWVNGDPLMPVMTNGMYIKAKNFGSFSSGPGFASIVPTLCWFIDFPQDFDLVKMNMPVQSPILGHGPTYVPGAHQLLATMIACRASLPGLSAEIDVYDAMKARKQRSAHPLEEYLAACKQEWEAYINMFKVSGMIDDRADPPYPYTKEIIENIMQQSRDHWARQSSSHIGR